LELTDFKRELRQFGLLKTLADVGVRGLNRAFHARLLKALQIEHANPEFPECSRRYHGCFLPPAQLMELARSEYELSPAFVDEACAKGDECYGFLDGGVLASYGWYSRRPTRIDVPTLMLHFDPAYVYMYKGFTHPRYRGQRLYGAGMTCALRAYRGRGYRGLVSYVECNNFSSLKSCYRMGYSGFGHIFLMSLRGRYIIRCDEGCRQRRFELKPAIESG
jgi:hypothetical protein